jgi:hypothetical protein
MKPLAIFYHTILSEGSVPIDTEFACSIMAEQMAALKNSGLLDAASEFYIGINGDESDAQVARLFAPAKAKFLVHGRKATSEIPTMFALRSWLPTHADHYVLYHHIKGCSHPNEPAYAAWRKRMERAVVWGWRNCVADLDRGLDSAGAHWLTPEQFPNLVKSPFWGGTFFWSTAKFLLTLPPLPPPTWANRFAAESWIGTGPRRPNVKDYCPGWP